MKSKLREVYEAKPFHQRKRFDDGGSAYSSYALNNIVNSDNQYFQPTDTSYAPVPLQSGNTLSAEDQAALNAYAASGPGAPTDVGPGPTINNGTTDVNAGSVPTVNGGTGSSSGGSSVSSQTAGALGKLLGLSGSGSSNSTGMQALQALIGLAGVGANYANNKANTPTFAPPALFGGQSGTTGANGSSGGYGPPGGYNFQNYKGATASTPGLGYAPRTAVTPNIPNYYTYGQGPQASFFTGSAPAAPSAPGAPAAPQSTTGGNPQRPVANARGGLMRKYAVGGRARHFIGGTPAPVSAPNAAPSSGLIGGNGQIGAAYVQGPPGQATAFPPASQGNPLAALGAMGGTPAPVNPGMPSGGIEPGGMPGSQVLPPGTQPNTGTGSIGTPTGVGSSGLLAGHGAMSSTAPPALGGAGTGALQGTQGPALTTAQQQFLAGNGPGAMNPANNPFAASSGAPSGVGALSPQGGAQMQPKPPAMSNALPMPFNASAAGTMVPTMNGGMQPTQTRPPATGAPENPASWLAGSPSTPPAAPNFMQRPQNHTPPSRMGHNPGMPQRPVQPQQPAKIPFHGMADGGSTVDEPSKGPIATSHVIQQPGGSPLSQMYQSRRQWQGPSSQNIGMPQGHASGGSEGPLSQVSRHVVGPGDGTSDSIPARLANGEWVMDAQTVSMLGNGSNDAGAKKLDAWRQNIRKQKGKALAKGEMAPDAHKNLNRYMK